MDEELARRMINGTDEYDEENEGFLRSTAREFYDKRARTTAIVLSAYCVFFYLLGIASAILFFHVDQTKYQIMYASLFVYFTSRAALVKTLD